MKARLSEISIAARESLISNEKSNFRHSSILNKEAIKEKLKIQVRRNTNQTLDRHRQIIGTTKEAKAPTFDSHFLEKGYNQSVTGPRNSSIGNLKLAPLNQKTRNKVIPGRPTKFLQNRKNLAILMDGLRDSQGSNATQKNFTVHPLLSKNTLAELHYENQMNPSKKNEDSQNSALIPINLPRRKNMILVPNFGMSYTLASNQKPNFSETKNVSFKTSLNNCPSDCLIKYQMIKENLRSKSKPDIFKKARNQSELDSLWQNTLVVDPEKIRDRSILRDTPAKISDEIGEKMDQNCVKMRELATDISQNLKNEMLKIVQPLKDEIRQKRHKLLKKIIEFLIFVKTLDIPPEIVLEFPTRSYQHPKSIAFIEYAKMGRSERLVDMMLRHSKLLVYEYDNFRLTALHWAVIREHRAVVDVLIEWGSFINATDIYERTPLYYAIENQSVYMVFEMLLRRASPWSPKDVNYIELANRHDKIIYYIKKFRMLDLMMKFQKPSKREDFRSYYLRTKIPHPY